MLRCLDFHCFSSLLFPRGIISNICAHHPSHHHLHHDDGNRHVHDGHHHVHIHDDGVRYPQVHILYQSGVPWDRLKYLLFYFPIVEYMEIAIFAFLKKVFQNMLWLCLLIVERRFVCISCYCEMFSHANRD